MKDKLLKFILDKNYAGVLTWGVDLLDRDRYEAIDVLMNIDLDEELKHIVNPDPYKRTSEDRELYSLYKNVVDFTALCCVRSIEDVYLTRKGEGNKEVRLRYSRVSEYLTNGNVDAQLFTSYLSLYKPLFISELAKFLYDTTALTRLNVYLFWVLKQEGYINVNEETIVDYFFDLTGKPYRLTEMLAFIKEHDGVLETAILPFYKYDVQVLDQVGWYIELDKWEGGLGTKFWDKVFQELLAKGKFTDRSIIANLLGSLTNSWKKGRLDWHVRLIKMFKPTKAEYLAHQELLFAALSSNSVSVRNYAVGEISKLYKEKGFDKELFLQSATFLFMQDKQDKTLLSVIEITDYVVSNDESLSTYIPDYTSLLLQPNEDVQTKAAQLLVKYIECSELSTLVTTYTSTIRQQTLEILGVDKAEQDIVTVLPIEHIEVGLPQTWEDFLFHVGKAIESEAVLDIDVLYESAITYLQNLTKEQVKQLAPHVKRAGKKNSVLSDYIYELLFNCIENSKVFEQESKNDQYYEGLNVIKRPKNVSFIDANELPLLREKNKALWGSNAIPTFLSTPSHTPFYVDPFIFVTKLIHYEEQGIDVVLDDLIVACNRILKDKITIAAQDLAKQLKGEYREAILYLLGVIDEIMIQEKYLPLWTQVARTKYPDRIFKEFEDTWCRDLPTVVKPFDYEYVVLRNPSWQGEDVFYDTLGFKEFKEYAVNRSTVDISVPFYYSRKLSAIIATRDVSYKEGNQLYELSLVPYYIETYLIETLGLSVGGSDMRRMIDESVKLQFLIEHQLKVLHSGWVYICVNLLFDSKTAHTLAKEYIQMAMRLGFFKIQYVANLMTAIILNESLAVKTFIKYMDEATSRQERELQYQVITNCITRVEKGKLPTNFKKMVGYYDEISNELGQVQQEQIILKRKELKL